MKTSFLEDEWNRYLKTVGISEEGLTEDQKLEWKRAFVAGVFHSIEKLQDISMGTTDEEFEDFLTNIIKDIKNFWDEDSRRAILRELYKKDNNKFKN